MDTQNPIELQHKAFANLIENTYGLNLKSFLTDVAEIVAQHSNSHELTENLWLCAQMLPMDPSRPK